MNGHPQSPAQGVIAVPGAEHQPDDYDPILDALEQEGDFIHRELEETIRDAKRMRRSVSDDLSLVDRSNVDHLLRNKNLHEHDRIALCIFKRRLANSKWLQIKDQKYDLLSAIGIAVTSYPIYGRRIAKCKLKGHYCRLPDHCHICAWWDRQGPALEQYDGALQKCLDRHWFVYAVTASYEANPEKAGAHLVVQKRTETKDQRDVLHHFRPFCGKGIVPVSPMVIDPDASNLERIKACFDTPFAWVNALKRSGIVVGAFGNRGLDAGFAPDYVVPHVHLAVVTRRPISPDDAKSYFGRLVRLYSRHPSGRVLYPDLHFSPLKSQVELNNWLVYILRPLDPVKPYQKAIQFGADMLQLNSGVEKFYHGGDQILREVTSPRASGCFRVNTTTYIGTGRTTTVRRREEAERKKKLEAEQEKSSAKVKGSSVYKNPAHAEAERRIRRAVAEGQSLEP